jgi:predicted esterase
MLIRRGFWVTCAILTIAANWTCPARPAEPATGYQASVAVSAPTRLDWVFALANQSPAQPPADWLPPGYNSTAQRYERFVPPDYNPKNKKKSWPVLLFISAGPEPAGWPNLEQACRKYGAIFASPFAAGNDCPMQQRVRIVLDVLDDVRRNYRTDPDRTYIGGISGGGRVACAIAFSLPELFGGAMPVCASGDLREEGWLRHRVIDRLSVAMLTGEQDFNRGEVERFRGPFLKDVGVNARVWVYPRLGHSIPNADNLPEVLNWLESGAAARRKLAKEYPASSLSADPPPGREAWSKMLLDEARGRLKQPKSLYSGLVQLQGIAARWTGLPAATTATELLRQYDAREDRPWEVDDLAEQRKFLVARARSIDLYGSGPLPEQYAEQRSDMLQAAIELWRQVVADSPDSAAGREGARRIPVLEQLLDGAGRREN